MPSPPAPSWTQIQAVFDDALERPARERTAWLREAHGHDPRLVREVAAMLDGHDANGTLLAGVALDLVDPAVLAPPLRTGERVGPWRLAERVGSGGMGDVYRATRADGAFEQTVALKLVKRGMDTEAVLRRFRAERQILARLQHPGIARLLDGGRADDGRPYLAMEFVDGEPITDHCDRLGLGVDARLALFTQVCEAVQYAHRQLVVHRDLKPSNILVTPGGGPDGGPSVKLLDFGIATLLAGDTGEALTLLTAPGHRVLTPEYAAPEQVAGGPVSTATDVYALGVVLYELLAGRRPYTFDARTPGVIEHVVRTVQPPRPSTVVGETPTGETHATPTERLRRRLAGDLDVICLMALRKEPERRYGSAEALADDLRRHGASLPVRARPDTVGYRTRRFARRHRGALAAAALSLGAIAVVAALALTRVSAERDRAESEAETAREVSGFLASLFAEADPSQALGDTLTVYEVLHRGADRLETDLAGRPAVRGELLLTIADAYTGLGENARGTAAYRGAIRAATEAEDWATAARAHAWLAGHLRLFGEVEVAVRHGREGVRLARQHLDPADPVYSEALNRLADVLRSDGAYPESEALFQEALALRRAHQPGSADLADTMNNYALLLSALGRFDESLALHHETLALRRAVLGEGHPALANSFANLAHTSNWAARYDDAVAWALRADSLHGVLYGPTHRRRASNLTVLAEALAKLGRDAEAATLLREVVAIEQRPGGSDGGLGRATLQLAGIARRAGRLDEAERLATRSLRHYLAQYGEDGLGDQTRSTVQVERGWIALARGDTALSRQIAEAEVAYRLRESGPDHRKTRQAQNLLAATGGR